ncbi:zinc finger MYM-type protein 1-like [Aphis craccivora]|uniref:Zinc finger MYM-type protein 1-like n=1 Tax=Aphis craccivora TaxID=307492 RepID=A0A6G0YP31_APHCR|nr:zinc finger MYM-type protein 1-like [Aphis craccivora]
MFERKHFNGQIINRPWLIYSKITGKVFCGPCRLFQETNNGSYLASEEYNDWRSAFVRLKEHENSSCHKTCVVKLMDRGNVTQRIDSKIMEQVNQEKIYWRSVLTRIVSIVKKLGSRGLPLRGHDEIIGSVNNGNFFMIVELLSEFEPFLSQHVTRFQNSGSGNISYLSSTIYEETIKLMSNKSYDNANNMSGSYKGLQARIRELNPLAFYIPCATHSLNLVGTHSVEASSQSVKIIEFNKTEKSETKCEARGLRIQLENVEMAFMAVLWGFLLDRLNAVSKNLQDVNIDVCTVLELYDSLIHLVNSQREVFDEYEEKALSKLCCIYKSDIKKNEFINELLHFRTHQITSFNEKKITPLSLLLVIYERNMKDLSNIEIALRIFVSTPATNCTVERSFSVLKRMKNYLRSTMSQERLNSLALLTIESDLTSSLEYEDIIDDFSRIKSRKKSM